MDGLTSAFAGGFQVSHAPNTTAAQHPRYSQYKAKGNYLQNNRRQHLLEIQKQRRFDALAHSRRLADDCWKGAEDEEEQDEDMDVQLSVRKPGRYYRNQLMMSEWLVEVPEDFEEEWLMVLCPVAKRSLVVASHGKTVAYNKGGYRTNTFPSYLPGGSRNQPGKYNDYTILDCLYQEATGTYWILDLMCWKSMPIYETETEFRFYWLHQNLQESPHLGVKRKQNPYCFQALPSFPCTPQAIEDALANSTFEIDGIIFFHKRTHYTFGSTPLVVWLKPYMVQDVLNIPVPQQYMSQTPEDYMGYAHHIAQVKADKHGNQHRRPRRSKEATPDGKKREDSETSPDKKEENGESIDDKVSEPEKELGMDVIEVVQHSDDSLSTGSRSTGSRSTGSIMETTASADAITQGQEQIKLLIRPTKFNFGELKMSDKITPSEISPSEQSGGKMVIRFGSQFNSETVIQSDKAPSGETAVQLDAQSSGETAIPSDKQSSGEMDVHSNSQNR